MLDDQSERSQVLKMSEREARIRCPSLFMAFVGASRKDKPNGVVTARVLFDGTNGISINIRTRIKVYGRSARANVAEAHRQVSVDEQDWLLFGCQVRPSTSVYVDAVSTSGVASTSYYWSRVKTMLGRLSQYIARNTARMWHLHVADEYHVEVDGPGYRSAHD